jgi:hypothetical protein
LPTEKETNKEQRTPTHRNKGRGKGEQAPEPTEIRGWWVSATTGKREKKKKI